eukprot:COSAG05_NODE_20348_length_280_cov_0.624309_1_plen_25_part_01
MIASFKQQELTPFLPKSAAWKHGKK